MFERYTERARRVLFFARYGASQLGSISIEPEHLLLGLVREADPLTSRIVTRHQVSLETVRADIESQVVVREQISTSVEIPFSHDVRKILQFAADEADRLDHDYIDCEHLLLALLRQDKTMAARVLVDRRLTFDSVRNAIIEEFGGSK
jgi:ATP-dependent Clp protease ATP-binding subunit ClpC